MLLSSAQLLTLNKRRELVSLVPLAQEQSALTLAKGLGSALLAGCSGGVVRLVQFRMAKSPKKGKKEAEEVPPQEHVRSLPLPNMLGYDAPDGKPNRSNS